jgi:mono/diheme cytochrome c family protein
VKLAIMAAAILAATAGGADADGAAVFDNSCAFCHQAGGVGVPGQFPRLAGRVGAIAAKPEGFDSLSDDDMAAVLSYLTGLDHAAVPFTADEIKAARAQPAPADMMAERARLSAAKIVP